MLCYLAYLEKYVIQQLKTQLVDCLIACSCCRHLSLFMKRGFCWNSVCKEAAWLDIEEDILFVSFFHWPCLLVTAVLLLGTWLSTSFPMCFSFLKKMFSTVWNLLFFLLFIEILLGVWNKEGSLWNVFLLQMVTFLGSKWNHLVETLMEKYHLWSLQNARSGDTNIVV